MTNLLSKVEVGCFRDEDIELYRISKMSIVRVLI